MGALKLLFSPLAFGLGFLTPLFAQSLTAAGVAVDGVPNLVIGAIIGLSLAIIAQLRGGWLWHRRAP